VLESETCELVIVAIPAAIASRIVITTPPDKRESTAFKLVFAVPDLAQSREIAKLNGGEIYPPAKEWIFQGLRVCDGFDPEGNVIQLREVAAADAETDPED
jgi:predicted enzyme related to lactoylglutathione lyase